MPLLKQPVSLESSSLKQTAKALQRAISQIAKGCSNIGRNSEDWEALLSVIRNLANLISVCSLPTSLLGEISRRTIRIFNKLFDESDESSIVNSTSKERADKVTQVLMKLIFNDARDVLNISAFKSAIGKHYIISNLASTPKIQSIRIIGIWSLTNSYIFIEKIKNNIHYLSNLSSLEFGCDCTDDIIKEISIHCPNVHTVKVRFSARVTDQSTPYLQNMKKLVKLYVKSTGMSTEGYRAVLEALPCIVNIHWEKVFITELLGGMTPEILNKKVKIKCKLDSARILVDKCPNVKTLTCEDTQNANLYPLTELKELKHLRINAEILHFGHENIFEQNGENLSLLLLQNAKLYRIDLIINYCVSLKTLKINSCTIYNIHNRRLLPESTHFVNLKSLILENNTRGRSFCQLVKKYVNLKTLFVVNPRDSRSYFSHKYFENALQMGGFRDLENFILEGCDDCTIRTARLVIEKCPKLRFISDLGTWGGVTQGDIDTLREEIERNNYDLEVF